MKRFFIGVVGAIAAAGVASPALAQAGGCTRESLKETAAQYRMAQETGRLIMHVRPMGEWVNYNENFELSSMSFGGVIATPQKVDWYRAFYDTVACSVYIESIITNPEHPYVLATMINRRGASVNSFDVIVSDQDDWLFNAEKTLYYAQREDWGVIPEAERNTRDELRAAADAYLDLFKDKSTVVPWGTPCARLEGSAYTGKGQPDDTCNAGVPENVDMIDRRYIIDPVVGSVAVFLRMGTNQRPDAHVFRVEKGKIRYVHTVTNCGDQENCGFGPFKDMLERNPNFYPNLDHVPVVTTPQDQ
jgi:hypothetical protein